MTEETNPETPALIAYRSAETPALPLVPAAATRDWMAKTRNHFANRCLPLVVANQAGWFVLNTHDVTVTWDGRVHPDSLKLEYSNGAESSPARSHFGHGILTFILGYLFRTSPGYNLLARGPANWPKVGAYALEGLVETDWAVATFTMNWKLTMPGRPVKFEAGEPICMLVPQKRGELETIQPVVRDLKDESELKRQYKAWAESRQNFLADLMFPESEAREASWQKHYYRGTTIDETPAPEHQTKLTLKPFVEPG